MTRCVETANSFQCTRLIRILIYLLLPSYSYQSQYIVRNIYIHFCSLLFTMNYIHFLNFKSVSSYTSMYLTVMTAFCGFINVYKRNKTVD